MTLGRITCTELTSVPDMVFEARRYEYATHTLYHIGDIFRTQMPEDSFLKVTYGLRDKLFLTHFI